MKIAGEICVYTNGNIVVESLDSDTVTMADFEAALALEDRQQVMLGQTEDFREATRAFAEKRAPEYRDR